MSTKDLVVQTTDGELVSWEDFAGDGWESDGTEDVRPSFPMVKIVQGTSKMQGSGKHGGDFYHSDTEQFTPTLTCTVLVKRDTRAYFDKDGDDALCLSSDGIKPMAGMPLWEGKDEPASCASCPFSQWSEEKGAPPPPCKLSNVLLIDRRDGDDGLAQLRISGKSLSVFRQFVARKCKPRNIPLYAYEVTFGTVQKTEPGKIWHELLIQDSKLLTRTEAKAYSDMLAEQRKRFEQTIEGEVEWQDDSHAAEPAVEWDSV